MNLNSDNYLDSREWRKFVRNKMRPKRAKPHVRLVALLRSLGIDIPESYTFERLRPGHWQRSADAWGWTIRWENGEVGSPDRVADFLRVKSFHYGPFGTIYVG